MSAGRENQHLPPVVHGTHPGARGSLGHLMLDVGGYDLHVRAMPSFSEVLPGFVVAAALVTSACASSTTAVSEECVPGRGHYDMSLSCGATINASFRGHVTGRDSEGTPVTPRRLKAYRVDPNSSSGLKRLGLNTIRGHFEIEVPSVSFSTLTSCDNGKIVESTTHGPVRYVFRAKNCAETAVDFSGETEEIEIEMPCRGN